MVSQPGLGGERGDPPGLPATGRGPDAGGLVGQGDAAGGRGVRDELSEPAGERPGGAVPEASGPSRQRTGSTCRSAGEQVPTGLQATEVSTMKAQEEKPLDLKWWRIMTITVAALLHVGLILIAFLVILDVWSFLHLRIAGLLGLVALGGAAAFFTACQSAMSRVCYKKIWQRGPECVYRASQLEALFRMLVGFSVGLGSYLLVLITEQLKD